MRKAKYLLLIAEIGVFSMTACGKSASADKGADASAEAKTCTGEAQGMDGAVKVEVKADANKIYSVTVTEQNETEGVGTKAVDELPGAIVEKQSLNVDAVSGATVTSEAIKEAVKNALESAGIDTAAFEK